MSVDPQALLVERFGFSEFVPGQREVIDALLAGHSAAAVFPTGGGKSLCYQLPALALDGLTLVVSPLIALMKDQIDGLARRGVRARRLDSTLSLDEYREVTAALRSGELQLLYVAPERFHNERFRGLLERLHISLFAVDEAHCISEWGHNFRPDYLKLPRFVATCGAERVLALTATATTAVLDDICRSFDIAPAHAVRTPFYRPNLRLLARPVDAAARPRELEAALGRRPAGATIVYVTLQRTAEKVSERLGSAGFDARAYHAGMKDEERSAVQEWFFASEAAVVVATIAFGMGIDKADIRYVYHFNLPKSLESYAQEIGRSGRDGEASVCEMLVCLDDLNTLENFAYGDTPTRAALVNFVDEIFDRDTAFDLSLHEISAACDIRLLVVRTLLTYLELDGYLEGGTPIYAQYQFQPQKSSAEILAACEPERRRFLADVFRRSKKGRIWFSLDAQQTARELGVDRGRVVRALEDLHEDGLLEVRASGTRSRYRRLRQPDAREDVVASLEERVTRREEAEVARLREVLAWVALDACQVRALGARFGDPIAAPCGHCSWCESQVPVRLPERPPGDVAEAVWPEVAEVVATEPILAEPRSLARFLTGVGSPALTRARLSRHRLFGRLAEVPFLEVLERARALSAAMP